MAVTSLRDTTLSALDNYHTSARPSSVAETIQIYHEDVPPLPPLKDAKHRNASHQRSLADTLGVFKTNTMYSSTTIYECEKDVYPDRHDSLLDSPFGYYFDPKVKDSLSQLVTLDREYPEALRDTYCSSSSFKSISSTASQRQSLLPPFSQVSPSSSEGTSDGQSLCPPPPRPLPATPGDQPIRVAAFESPSKRSITPLKLEKLRHAPLPARLHNRSRTPSPTSGLSLSPTRLIVPSFSSTSTSITSSTLNPTMSPFSTSETLSLPTTAGPSFSAPTGNGSRRQRRRKDRKPANIVQPACLSSTIHGRCISSPLETKSTSSIGANFDPGLPSHDFVTQRQSPIPPIADASGSTPPLISACTASLGTPTSPSSLQPLLSPFQEQFVETSAFDSDTDDEGRSSHAKTLYKKVSRPLLKPSRTRAETRPSANTHNISKGASLPKRVSKQDTKTPGLRFSDTSSSPAGCGITMVRISDSSIASPVDARPFGTAGAPATLRTKMSNRESPPSKPKRTSEASNASQKSSISSKTTTSLVGGGVVGSRRNTSSGERVRSWFSRVFAKRNTL